MIGIGMGMGIGKSRRWVLDWARLNNAELSCLHRTIPVILNCLDLNISTSHGEKGDNLSIGSIRPRGTQVHRGG